MPTATSRKATAIASLSTTIPQIFNDAQKPNANQRKHAIALRKIQEQCALNSPIVEDQPQDIDAEGEAAFIQETIRNLNKILRIRKREPHADRIIRFVATFIQYTQQLDSKDTEKEEDNDEENEEEEEEESETVSSRFVEYLMRHLLRGMKAKSKSIRLRCCQIIALSINSLGEIDEDLYQDLRQALFERIKDKESSIRIQAATALSRLQNADDEVDEADGKTITQKLVHILQHDPSAEVRRVVLFNLDQTKETLPFIIERARDVDAINRRVVFLKPMADLQDFRMLTVQQRHQLLKWGLNDRDPLVRRAASRVIATHWIRHADHNLLEFLERMDVVEGDAAEDILTAFLSMRIDIINDIKFDDQFWDNLSPESAFLAKVFIKFLQSKKYDEKLDALLPEVTRHAFYIQNYNHLWQQASKETEGDYEFIIGQLLDIAKCLDYADEVGRRKMFVLLREILMVPDIPDDHLKSIVELFRIISLDEKDFTRTMMEIISDIQEVADTDDTNDLDMENELPAKRMRLADRSMTVKNEQADEETDPHALRQMVARLKCLTICKHMLEHTEESLHQNSTVYGLLNELIVPSVQSKEIVLREEGLYCLGLCCMLDKTLGIHNINLFVHLLRNGHAELQQRALMILFDLIMTFGLSTVVSKMESETELHEIFEFCLDHDNVELQAIAVEGIAKLMLHRLFQHEETLKLLVLLYYYPSSVENTKAQQCLTYFFPAFCYSSAKNQAIMAKIAIPTLEDLCSTYADLDKDEDMVSPSQISDMLADWTDPRKVAKSKISRLEDQEVDLGLQADMALQILSNIYNETGVTRKTMCHMLSKIYIAEGGEDRLQKILTLCETIEKEKPIKEVLIRNSFRHFIKSVKKHLQQEDAVVDDQREDDSVTA